MVNDDNIYKQALVIFSNLLRFQSVKNNIVCVHSYLEEYSQTCIHLKDVNSLVMSKTRDHLDYKPLFNKVFYPKVVRSKQYMNLPRSGYVKDYLWC